MRECFCIALFILAVTPVHAQTWKALGPSGGDVRVLATDPSRRERIFLGTADGHIFGSEDSGAHWTLLGRASTRSDAVITSIVVDPRNENALFAASWTRDSAAGGGIFRSLDGGRTWSEAGLGGEAVRTLAMAPSNPDVLVAGTLHGIYRSDDASKSWQRISPENHDELRNLDSLAIDPRNPQIIYAGTFHLPWKTTDGGRTWNPIHRGMIEDSDVMSLLIDVEKPERMYASACSGIYQSDDSAGQWRKIQGIPYTARRTYAITQDLNHPGHVYAATSEGLWKTEDGGMTWRRTTPESWVINTVVVTKGDPGRMLIGTEDHGVLASDDFGEHFQDANAGFEHRQIVALGAHRNRPGQILAVIAHSPDSVLATEDGGQSWSPLGSGFRADQILRIFTAPDHSWWASLSSGGLMRYDPAQKSWMRVDTHTNESAKSRSLNSKVGRRVVAGNTSLLDVVSDIEFRANNWYAATSAGLLVSADRGLTWRAKQAGPLTALPLQSVRVSSDERRIRVVSQRGMLYSDDAGNSWEWHDLPLVSGGALALFAQPGDENTLVAMAHKGLYISRDWGKTWDAAGPGLPSVPVQDFAAAGANFAASMRTGGLYLSSDAGRTWNRASGNFADDFFTAVVPSEIPGVIFAASSTEGLYKVQWSGTR